MAFVKKTIKRSFLYGLLRLHRARKAHRQWTAHDQKMLAFYSQFVSAGSLCFDIGAHMGSRTKIFLKLQAHVVAVDPQKDLVGILRSVYPNRADLTVVHRALGESAGMAEVMICSANTLSSLSEEWIESVIRSGRFPHPQYTWDEKQLVPMTTLDRLMEQYGIPSFIKIDVEGYEYQVVTGLSQPVNALSLEFTPEFIEATFKCFDHLQSLGDIRLNYSVAESMVLALEEWVSPQEMIGILSSLGNDGRLFGDVYVRFVI